jgi:transposase
MEREDARKISPAEQGKRRRQVIQAWKRGRNRRQIAAQTGLSYSTVRAAINRYKEFGAPGLRSRLRGRPPWSCNKLTVEQEQLIQKMIQEKRPEQVEIDFARWTRPAVMMLIERECGVKLGTRGVGMYLARWGFKPKKPLRSAFKKNPRAIRK